MTQPRFFEPRFATITFYDQEAYLIRRGLLKGSLSFEPAIPKPPTVADIKTEVAAHFQIPLFEMTSARRAREVARPRQVAMYLSKRLTPQSLPAIGHLFGGRDHTTVIWAVRQIEKLMLEDSDLASSVATLVNKLVPPRKQDGAPCIRRRG